MNSPTQINKDSDNETKSNGFIDLLSNNFRTQAVITDKERVQSLRPRPNVPALRKRSSSNLIYSRSNQDTKERRRDSGGINYSSFITAFTEYQNKKDEDNEPLFTIIKREEPSEIEPNSPIKTVTPNTPNSNRGRITKRLSATINSPIYHNPHGNSSNSSITKTIQTTDSIEPYELATLLNSQTYTPLLIDMRPLDMYEKSRIRPSIHINVPTLLIKRYRRGVVSNFNLESFISTANGMTIFQDWLRQFKVTDIQDLPAEAQIVLYDETMAEGDKSLAVWVLMGVIQKSTDITVNWLKSGFEGFEGWDFTHSYLDGSLNRSDTPPLPLPSSIPDKDHLLLFNLPNKLKLPTPKISRSTSTLSTKPAPVGKSTDGPRRASLFNLDTTNIKATASFKDKMGKKRFNEINENIFSPAEDQFHTPHEVLPPPLPTTSTTSLSSQDSLEMVTAIGDMTPKTENEYDFIISEIIPKFLYLGPEIVTPDQLVGLKSRSIKRILNMAEECDDDVPGLKEYFHYTKVAARDTVEMQNVQGTLKKAVQVINESKKHHEPIYVHCKAGKSRSAAAILAYLIVSENWTLKKAYKHIVQARPNISPNIGFVAELMKMEQVIHGKVSNFAGHDWTQHYPSSPDTQKEMNRLEKAWKRGSRSSTINE